MMLSDHLYDTNIDIMIFAGWKTGVRGGGRAQNCYVEQDVLKLIMILLPLLH